ncbi:TetR/AcrR family transcriptional regulator [Spongiibacter sp. KMU-166]|uniref:TetR/AcrR family transcriptional regulator n=1 Tax=Spongiibacter thalassae TaxID=2721624 RepID=A0ABX1GFX5_9GAMM|nr:TetR/AcrR family transcriptional regulator [Spongiibacter thalassae]NKI18073.1 TetR/AcrR family transcriptional regulator [Spongiibacter thalassae]
MRKVDHDSRREEVAEAAARLIAEQGLDALTTRALAKSLGCSIGVLSHYFNSKEDIVIAAFRWADQRIDLRMQEAIANDAPGLEDFFPVIKAGLPLDKESDLEWRVRLNLHAFALSHQASMAAERDKNTQFRTLMREMIADMQRRKRLRSDISPDDLTLIAFDIVMGMASNLLMTPFDKREARAEYLFRFIELLRPPG